MNDNNSTNGSELNRLKIEEPLPVTAVGIENMKESYSDSMSPHRRLFKWFARRPTSATRLAILASLLPAEVSNDELLRLIGIGPKENIDQGIEDYVIDRQATKSNREGSVEDHFGYEYPHRSVPNKRDADKFEQYLSEVWGQSKPTVLDPTAGGGTIPLEASRYGLPTFSNDLNPIAWVINKVILNHAREVGSLEKDVQKWSSTISDIVRENLREFYPDRNGVEPDYYFRIYSIECPSCGKPLPLTNRWWFNRKQNVAIQPTVEEGKLSFDCINTKKADEVKYDPNEGTVNGGDAECISCGVVTERDVVTEKFQSGEFEYEVCAVKYEEKIQGTKYHSPQEDDYKAIKAATEKVNNNLELKTLLNQDRYIGRQDRAAPYGITKWRDLFSPRQLLGHAEYLKAFDSVKEDIHSEYDAAKAEAILTLLALSSVRQVNNNCRLIPIHIRFGYPNDLLGNNNFAFQWHFGEVNPLTGGKSYESWVENVLESYEKVVKFHEDALDKAEITVRNGDAAALPIEDNSIQAVVIDPPYGDNVMYAELSDALYVWLRKYLSEIFPESFSSVETNKKDEAVENSVISTPQNGETDVEAARREYENKMSAIFSETYRVLEPGGVITIYFTDKEVEAWDALTMSLIEAGFTVTATHTITSEMPQRIGMRERSSADTTLLLTCRKPSEEKQAERQATLWSDVEGETERLAREKANELLDSSLKLTKTDTIIGAFGPTLRVFTENYPVVDIHDNLVRPRKALEMARKAVTEVLINRELQDDLDDVDNLTTWYILSWLVYGRDKIPYDEARQLGLGVGVEIDEVKTDTKIWSKSKDSILLKGQDYRVRDYTAIEAGEKRRKRAYPVNPIDESFDFDIDAVHSALNVIETKGSDFTWNWLNERGLQNNSSFKRALKSLIQVLPEDHNDYELLINLASGQTGDLLDINAGELTKNCGEDETRTTLTDFE